MTVELKPISLPDFGAAHQAPRIPGSTYETRVRAAYEKANTDWLVVYSDREHIAAIAYLSGFEPRFEEAFLLIGPNERRVLLAGNESQSYAPLAGLPGLDVLVAQSLSLMGQDRSRFPRLLDRFRDAGIKKGDSVGLVGWKYLEPEEDEDLSDAFFVPAVHLAMLRRLVGAEGSVRDVSSILFHPGEGLMTRLDVDQLAAFEWAATRASLAVWRIVSGVREGDDEFQAASRMGYAAEPLNVHTMLASASGSETVIGLRSANGRLIKRGDGITTAVGMWGALASRAGLFDKENNAFLKTASSYFEGLSAWYETADIGVAGGELFEAVTAKLAEGDLGSALNPGHLTGYEEWTHSPVRPNSTDKLASGMAFQVDVIPVPMPGNWALNCEDPVFFADEALREELRARHPETARRIEARRKFVREELGIAIKPNILPLSATPLCLAPFWLRSGHLLAKS
ncbi:MAG: Xaa-Pro aminopeptidase [Mesorhizobium amorphae]|nr:MAG: Xaa-Pro aminopeptidase [Mesorhizobium amorphae]